MNRTQIVKKIITDKIVAVVRLSEDKDVMQIIDAIYKGGITSIEITMTTPNAIKIIEMLNNEYENKLLVGVGSVINVKMAEEAISAGAKYVVSPVYNSSIIEISHKKDIPAMPGCFTPTEIYQAYETGADIIKVFPANITGMKFFKAVKAPLPFLKLMPTGGVSLTNANEWIKAGACAVGVGSALLEKEVLADKRYDKLTDNAKTLIKNISQ
jgi:2-dehydro-3-deoxyphosphogluconate aldolase/(4S)-4-hydroxy-2-oxoglutarate aldolase